MEWLDDRRRVSVEPAVALSLLRQAVAAHPDNTAARLRLAAALLERNDLPAAAAEYERVAAFAPDSAAAWSGLVRCRLAMGEPDSVLAACRSAASHGADAATHYARGCALRQLGRTAQARDAFTAALAAGDTTMKSLKALLEPLAKEDAAELLAFCDALAPPLRRTAMTLGFRAIALSRLGRTGEARRIVDLDRHIAIVMFSPPPQFGGIARYNAALARDILGDPAPRPPDGRGVDFNYSPHFRGSATFTALRDFMRTAITDYIADAPGRGLDAVMAPPPARAMLGGATLVLRGDGHNGEHMHGSGYVSAVYYVSVPDSVSTAMDNRGALLLGDCRRVTGGHVACWGTRHIKPVAGNLVIFPSHFFHDVVPSLTDEPRISIPADLQPLPAAST